MRVSSSLSRVHHAPCWTKNKVAEFSFCLLRKKTHRYFGTNRVGSNLVPDHVNGLSSCHLDEHLASDKDELLYEAEIDHGKGFRCIRFEFCCIFTPCGLAWLLSSSLSQLCAICSCDEAFLWVRKEYSTRTHFRIYPNRIEIK